MPIYQLGKYTPRIDPSAFIAESANIIGNVVIEAGASVWFGCTVRADNDLIVIGAGSNIQDGSVLHADPGFPVTIGKNVTVGHMAVLHGCTVGDGALVGIRATVLNGSVIGPGCIVGAGALITEGKNIPENSVMLGAPAKVARVMSQEDAEELKSTAAHYVMNNERFKQRLVRVDGQAGKPEESK